MSINLKNASKPCFVLNILRHFGINKKLKNQALLYDRTKGEIYVSRGENMLYLSLFDHIYGKVSRAPYLLSALDHITIITPFIQGHKDHGLQQYVDHN